MDSADPRGPEPEVPEQFRIRQAKRDRLLAESETIQHHEPDLTLVGLRLVFERNQ